MNQLLSKGLTQEMIDRYRDNGSNRCLFCESENISAEGMDSSAASEGVECLDCGENWQDLYKLIGVGYEGEFPLFTKLGGE